MRAPEDIDWVVTTAAHWLAWGASLVMAFILFLDRQWTPAILFLVYVEIMSINRKLATTHKSGARDDG